jgi:dolichol-phosphate mannosyltransferase
MTEIIDHPRISIVVPVRNEAMNIKPLIAEIETACAALQPFELIYVNDGSSDNTANTLEEVAQNRPWLHILHHRESCGQSASVRSGVQLATAPFVVTLDGDGQNDPSFIPALFKALQAAPDIGLAAGQRVGRQDTSRKKLQSRIANAVRGFILKDGTRDSGCGLKAFRREVYLNLPYFDALHRFMPALVVREGFRVVHVDVQDRPRMAGRSNYGLFDRLWVGIMDLLGVWWLMKRRRKRPHFVSGTKP